MTQLRHEVRLIAGYDKRGETPNYGTHPPHLWFLVFGPHGCLQLEVNTGWYPSSPPGAMEVWRLDSHAFLTDLHVDVSEVCDHCDLIGEPCHAQGTIDYDERKQLTQSLKTADNEWLWNTLDAMYLHFYEGAPRPSFKKD